MTPQFSVIVPTANRPLYLRRALESVEIQGDFVGEVLIVDDGQPLLDADLWHSSTSVLSVGASRINLGNQGVSAARNAGLQRAAFDFVAFLDDDDEWKSGYLQSVAGVLSGGADMVCTDFVTVGHESAEVPEKDAPSTLNASDFFSRNPGIRGSNLVIRTVTARDIGGFDVTLPTHNDVDFGLRCALSGSLRYARNARRLVKYFQHNGPRLSSPRTPAKRRGLIGFFEKYEHLMSDPDRQRYVNRAREMWGVFIDPSQRGREG